MAHSWHVEVVPCEYRITNSSVSSAAFAALRITELSMTDMDCLVVDDTCYSYKKEKML